MLEGGAVTAQDAAAPRSLPDLPQLRDDLSVRRALRPRWSTSAGTSSSDKVARARRPSRARAGRCARACSPARAVRRGARARARWREALLPRALARKIPARARAGDVARAASRAPHAGAAGLRAASARAGHRRRAGARARSHRHLAAARRPGGGCCGAISDHLGAHDEALDYRATQHRRVVAARRAGRRSDHRHRQRLRRACVKDYGHLLRDDPAYADKAQRASPSSRAIRSK